jgi:glutamate-ammonia-ligase adenylyltransferase
MKRTFPPAADADAAERLRENFCTALGPAGQRFAGSANGAAILACLGGNAPYLADLALREPDCLTGFVTAGPDSVFADILAALNALAPEMARADLAAALRAAKRRAALTIALADIAGAWPLERVTGALSDVAQGALRAATRHLLHSLHVAGKIALPAPADPERDCGFVALALGKLGAAELNYSSDIDLVLLYDPDNPAFPDDAQTMFARFARDLVALLANRDADGYVFRVDLRLRPDPAATPAIVALPTALRYYESHGRTWERAAFSKAKPIAGDIGLGLQFLAAIRPFIWRKNLDFAAISDIHDMKRQIDAGQDTRDLELLGRDVKLGQGGIREIEFLVQTLSLVWGGQNFSLRIPATLQALPALARAGHLPAAAAAELAADYRTLRRVEHRLQMVDDRQTHNLPASAAGLAAFAVFLGEGESFHKHFTALLARVHGHFAAFFNTGADPDPHTHPGRDGPPPAAFAAHLRALGFSDIRHVTGRLRDWLFGDEMAALRSERARALLEAVIPDLLAVFGEQTEPDRVFVRFDSMLSRQRAGVNLLSLFQRNPALLRRLAAVLGAAPVLAEYLAEDAQALESLLVPEGRAKKPLPALRELLTEAADLEQAVAITRRFVRREEFYLSVATLEGRMDVNESGQLRSTLAAAALSLLLPRVLAAHEARYGKIPGGAFAVVALGKAGSGEMMAGSDLDLMLLYDHAARAEAPSAYYNRLSSALIAALTARGVEGPLYKVDMRLRPSGNKGPVAVSLAAFRTYHASESWTWERLALTRARILAATPRFSKKIEGAILTALSRPDAAAKIAADTVDMRNRLAAEFSARGPFDVKNLAGGLMEVGFIAQALQLIHGPADRTLFHANTAASLRALADAGHLPDGDILIAAENFWRCIQAIDRLTGLAETVTDPPLPNLTPLLRATNLPDLEQLRASMAETAATVRICFNRYLSPGD